MKKLAIVLLLVAAACRRQTVVVPTTPQATNAPGAASPSEAIARFLGAAKAQDLQAFAMIWGSEKGPAIETMEKNERDMREITLLCYLKHDSFKVNGEKPGTNNERVYAVELHFKGLTRSANFTATLGPKNRWYVRQVDIEPLRDICARR